MNTIWSRQGLRKDKHKDKYKDKYKNNRQTYDVICFWKGDDNRSLIMKNVVNIQSMQNIQNMQNMQNMRYMQNMLNISPMFFLVERPKN